ncbi:MAG: NAD(P)/FAD-dependent oxidoreductase [Halothece sp.]
MKNYDFIVIGGGITGASLAYELQAQGGNVLLLESDPNLENATRYSYGGLPFWSGTSPEMRELCAEGMRLHRELPTILDQDTEYQEINLLLTIRKDESPEEILDQYQGCEIPPQLLSVEESCEIEPLLNPSAIAASIYFPHGQINPKKTNQAYLKTFTRLGGKIQYEAATALIKEGEKIKGVKTAKTHYYADKTILCAGGLTHNLLREIGVKRSVYFTQAELLETPPLDLKLNSLIMPGTNQRLNLEKTATNLWDNPEQKLANSVIDPGVAQFQDQHLCIGQISRIFSNPNPQVVPFSKSNVTLAPPLRQAQGNTFAPLTQGGWGDLNAAPIVQNGINSYKSESWLRQEVGELLPKLKEVPAKWHHCLIAFNPEGQSTIGKIEGYEGVFVFSGFTSTLLFAPPLARKFARSLLTED